MATVGRIAVLALSAVACAAASGAAALCVQLRRLPPDDLAHGSSISQLLHDPFVAVVFLTFVGGGALFAFLFSLWALRSVQLWKAVPLGVAVSVVAAATGAAIYPPASALVALCAALGYMLWCRRHAAWAIPSRPEKGENNGAT